MAWSVSVDEKTGIREFAIEGPMEVKEVIAALEYLYAQAFEGPRLVLWDLRAVTAAIPTIEIQQLVGFVRHKRGPEPGRAAIVIDKDVGYGLVRMFTALINQAPAETRAFRETSQAYDWLKELAPTGERNGSA